jgi:hypothetical protein
MTGRSAPPGRYCRWATWVPGDLTALVGVALLGMHALWQYRRQHYRRGRAADWSLKSETLQTMAPLIYPANTSSLGKGREKRAIMTSQHLLRHLFCCAPATQPFVEEWRVCDHPAQTLLRNDVFCDHCWGMTSLRSSSTALTSRFEFRSESCGVSILSYLTRGHVWYVSKPTRRLPEVELL